MKLVVFFLLIISGLFCASSTPKLFRNYVQYTSSPNDKFKLIGVPNSDANSTSGEIYILLNEDRHKQSRVSIDNFARSVFVISNNGEILYKIFDRDLGFWPVRDPGFGSWMLIYKEGEPEDTIRFDFEFSLLGYDSEMDVSKLRNKKKFRVVPEMIACNLDTLRIGVEGLYYFIEMNTGRLIAKRKDKGENFKNLNFKFQYKNVFQREKVMENIEHDY